MHELTHTLPLQKELTNLRVSAQIASSERARPVVAAANSATCHTTS